MAQIWDLSTLKADAGGSEFKGSSDRIGRLRLIILFDIIKTYLLNSRAKNAIHWYSAGLYELSLWLIYIIEKKTKTNKNNNCIQNYICIPCFCNFNCLQQKDCGICLLIFSFKFFINK